MEAFGNFLLYLFAFVVAACLAVVIIFRMILDYRDFAEELNYIKLEIRRTRGKERKLWKKRKRRLILSLLMFRR